MSDSSARRLYDQALDAAYSVAARQVAWDEAFEIAHDVASEATRRFSALATDPEPLRSLNAWIHRAVLNRLRSQWRSGARRAAAESVHAEEREGSSQAWSAPGLALDEAELARVVDRTLAAMPDAMREVFLLVRREGLSYRDAAARLDIGVGTVHTQLSRANARLRDAIAAYRGDRATKNSIVTGRKA